MKKLMTSMIIILPLLILTIMLVSGAIMGMVTHIYVESVEFVRDEALVLVMDDEKSPPTERLEVNVLPLEAGNRRLIYTVGDESIASVDERGVLTAKFYGETYVIASSAENGAATAKRKVIVTDSFVHKLVMNEGYRTEMYEGETQELSVAVYPREAENRSVTWTSSDETILHVGANGALTSVGAGVATITATSDENPSIFAEAQILCHKRVREIRFDRTLVVTSLTKSKFPEVKPVPADADISLSYEIDHPEIATVDENGVVEFHREGHVSVTVRATDFGKTEIEGKKEYTSTDGYFLPPLFSVKEYTVNYDESREAPLPVLFSAEPEGSYREIVGVDYSYDGVIRFDGERTEFVFVGEMPKGMRFVDVTVHAKVYSVATGTIDAEYEDRFRINVERDAAEVYVSYRGTTTTEILTRMNTLTFTAEEGSEASLANVRALPENHTNEISFAFEDDPSGIASLSGAVLTFKEEGAVRIRIEFLSSEGRKTAEKTVSVVYARPETGDKEIEIGQNPEEERYVVLFMGDDDHADKGVIDFTEPEGMEIEYRIERGEDVIRLEEHLGYRRILPLSGGFATVKIVLTPSPDGGTGSSEGGGEYTIRVYVDRPVESGDFSVEFNEKPCADRFRTSLDSVQYRVSVLDRKGSMAGKKLYVSYNGTGKETDAYTDSERIAFGGFGTLVFTFGVEYGEEVPLSYREEGVGVVSVTRMVETSGGNLDEAPTVRVDGGQSLRPNEVNLIEFGNIGEEKTLSVERNFLPEDFDLAAHNPVLNGTEYVKAEISKDGATIRLTAKKPCSESLMQLSVGGKTFDLSVTVRAKADTISVRCGEQPLSGSERYQTLLGKLSVSVTVGRADGLEADDKRIEYSLGDEIWREVGAEGNVEFEPANLKNALLFRSADGGASVGIQIEKVAIEDFGVRVTVPGESEEIGSVPSVRERDRLECTIPSDAQDSFTIQIELSHDYLGGLGSDRDFAGLIEVDLSGTGWRNPAYDAGTGQITVKLGDNAKNFHSTVVVSGGGYSLNLLLSRVNIKLIEFAGFDGGKSTDVYPGYQQVRVFARQSRYDGKTEKYFKMPYAAWSDVAKENEVDPTDVAWTLSRYVGSEQDRVVTRQKGLFVTSNGAQYEIVRGEGVCTLRDAEGRDVSESVTWVDPYSERGFARVYFGKFGGLSETDVRNDYFGNFGERQGWQQTPNREQDDGSGRDFRASENAYSFLRVEAGDGAKEGGANAHFNFNVLDGDDVINVFDSEGYCACNKVVLHNSLYGAGESNNADPALILNETAVGKLGKNIIYGNGFQISLQAKNAELIGRLGDRENTGTDSVDFGNLYNVTVKGASSSENINAKTHKIIMRIVGAYYSDLQNYSKIDPNGNAIFFKNTTMRYVANAAVQLFSDGSSLDKRMDLYFENTVLAECLRGASLENGRNFHLHFKGFLDILTYYNAADMQDKIGNLNGATIYKNEITERNFIKNANDYLEWFGSDGSVGTAGRRGYINAGIMMSGEAAKKTELDYWDDRISAYSENGSLENNLTLTKALSIDFFGFGFVGVSYDSKIDTDGGTAVVSGNDRTTSRDMNELFSDRRDIRLLCQYRTMDGGGKPEKNTAHILWHMQKAYRDVSLIENRERDHIKHLKSTLKGVRWPDGTEADKWIDTPAAAMYEMISRTVLPERKEYE